jgi:hypothetical protein
MPPCDHSATAALGGAEDAEREPEEAVAEEQNASSRSKGPCRHAIGLPEDIVAAKGTGSPTKPVKWQMFYRTLL